ncbi:MAG: DUF2283 domain-containing protein [Ignavibacteriales bacterium]|nr:DUF2283 domain-containing protein [Ignavibacteriales bacterium]
MNFYYDKQGDILDISVGEPQEAISEEMGDDIILRRDIKTNGVVGFTILNFEKRFQDVAKRQSIQVNVRFAA